MEKILPPSISKLHHSLPRPTVDRSMTDSFMSDCSGILPHTPSSTRSNMVGSEQLTPSSPSTTEEALTPIANWAHLSLLKNERKSLRSQLNAQQAANSEAQASMSALRRLAMRLAVNVSVKEKRIANTVRGLAQSRKSEYVSSRNADKRIERLTEMWKEEERRNLELLESLERAAMLTLQYSETSSSPAPRRSLDSGILSPPPSPPARGLRHMDRPVTPTSSPSLTWDSTKSIGTPLQMRTSNDRLSRAKRDSENAVQVCRSRIKALQADCLQSKETARLLDLTRAGLEEEIRLYQNRVSALEISKAAVEKDLRSKESELEAHLRAATELKSELEKRDRAIAELQQCSRQDADIIKGLKESKVLLEERVSDCMSEIQKLETNSTGITEELRVLQGRLDAAEHREADLVRMLTEQRSKEEIIGVTLKQSQTTIQNLEEAVAVLEKQVKEYQQHISQFKGEVSWLSDGLRNSEQLKARLEGELATAKKSCSELESTLQSMKEQNDSLQQKLGFTRTAMTELEQELLATKDKLTDEAELRGKLQAEVDSLRVLKAGLETDMANAQVRIKTLEQPDPEIQKELERLTEAKSCMEQQLTEVQQSSSQLEQELEAENGKLAAMKASLASVELRLT